MQKGLRHEKKIFLLFVFCGHDTCSCHSVRAFFTSKSTLFEEGQFSEAVVLYEQVDNPSTFVLMNCGIAYFNMEQYARARAFFNQSQKQYYW